LEKITGSASIGGTKSPDQRKGRKPLKSAQRKNPKRYSIFIVDLRGYLPRESTGERDEREKEEHGKRWEPTLKEAGSALGKLR